MSERPRTGPARGPIPAASALRVEVALDDPAWPAAVRLLGLSPLQASVAAMMTQDATPEQVAAMLGGEAAGGGAAGGGGGDGGGGGWTPSMAAVYMEDIIHQLGVFDRAGLKHAVVRALMAGEESQ